MADAQVLSTKLTVEALNQRLRNFSIRREIGHGAMGVVYEAEQVGLGRRVAVKVLPPNLALRERTVKRFLREAEAMGRLGHANIVDIFDVGSEADLHYFAMRFVEGPPLDVVVKAGPLALGDVVKIGIDVADALAHAHARGVMHRDIKPSNLLRDGDRVVLTDFGLARSIDSEDAAMTESGDLVGTPLYMSPEQIAGDASRIDGRADVWGLGVTLYELLTQRPPFTGGNATAILNKILHKDPPALHKLREDLPRDLQAVIQKCLEKDPARRYSGAAALADDLRAVRDGNPVSAATPRFFDPLVRWGRRHPVQTALGVLALLTLGAFGIWAKSAEQGQAQALEGKRRVNALAALIGAQREWMVAETIADPDQAAIQKDLARSQVEALIDTFPVDEYPEILVEAMSVLAFMLRNEDRAAGERLVNIDPDTIMTDLELRLFAALKAGLGSQSEALAAHARRLELDPYNAQAMLDAARIHRQLGLVEVSDPQVGRAELDEAVRLLSSAFDIVVLEGPDDLLAQILTERARALAGRGDRDPARADLEEATRLDPTLALAEALRRQLDTVPQTMQAQLARGEGRGSSALTPTDMVEGVVNLFAPLSGVGAAMRLTEGAEKGATERIGLLFDGMRGMLNTTREAPALEAEATEAASAAPAEAPAPAPR